jgi:hypothetical protein
MSGEYAGNRPAQPMRKQEADRDGCRHFKYAAIMVLVFRLEKSFKNNTQK